MLFLIVMSMVTVSLLSAIPSLSPLSETWAFETRTTLPPVHPVKAPAVLVPAGVVSVYEALSVSAGRTSRVPLLVPRPAMVDRARVPEK